MPGLGLELALVLGAAGPYHVTTGSPLWSSDHLEPPQASHGAHGNVDRLGVQRELNHRPRGPGLTGAGCPEAAGGSGMPSSPAGHLSLPRTRGRLQEAARPAGREERAPWPLCSVWGLGASQAAGRGRMREGASVGGSMAGTVPSCGAGPCTPASSAEFAESADPRSPRARLGSRLALGAADPAPISRVPEPPNLPALCPGRARRDTQAGLPASWGG